MSKSVLILGASGTGKSTAIRTLPPEHTFIINVIGKDLPFRGALKRYTKLSSDGLTGNYYSTDSSDMIRRVLSTINTKRPDIKYVVIDDAGYLYMNSFMRKVLERGYDKYTLMAKQFSDVLEDIKNMRDDLFCFVTMHVEQDHEGKTKPKTIGNMIDKHVCIEGQFSYVLHTHVHDGKYQFITNNDNTHMCKSPMGLFPHFIDNDLLFVANEIDNYLSDEV